MQASAFSTLKMGAVRVGGPGGSLDRDAGIDLDRPHLVEPRRAVIAASLVAGQDPPAGRAGDGGPISAMLILGVTSPNVAAEIRVLNT